MIVSRCRCTVLARLIHALGIGVLMLGVTVNAAFADEAVSPNNLPPVPEHECDLLTLKAYSNSWEEEQEAFKNLDRSAARASCLEAVRDHAGVPRFEYQLGWAIGDADTDEAVRLALRAAKTGYAPAQRRIGELILFGLGFEQDAEEGLRWLRQAAEQGFVPASAMLANIYILGLGGVEIDEGKAAHWARAGAEGGHPDAQYLYGQLLRQGIGVSQNEAVALEWFLNAEAQGNQDAADMAKFLTDKLGAAD